ncbi:hypothetical protein [Glutamicibacter arilaitensis]|uniref:hypothetical protein n=1 Tax=Glutamicibacter arilaitensis TaxID=256701 RepID=UPI003F8E1204
MARSRILDRGLEDMFIYPEVTVVDKRGNTVQVTSDVPYKLRVTTSVDQGSDAELSGQVSIKVLRAMTRSAPLGTYSRIIYAGEEWDTAYPPRKTPGLTRATRHIEFGIRSRNIFNVPDPEGAIEWRG